MKPFIALFLLSILHTLSAEPDPVADCDWACASHDGSGNSLLAAHSEFPPFTSPYSIFNCVYALRPVQPCRYYKKSGEFALGGPANDCPASAIQACAPGDPKEALAAHPQEVMPWMERGAHFMWLLANPVHKP